MIVNFQQLAPLIAACITTGGIVFQIGKQSERLEMIGFNVQAQEKKYVTNYESINDINNKLSSLINDMSHVKTDINEIKTKMKY
jgi:hypothetical protein